MIIADTLSPAHLSQTKEETCAEIETYVHSLFLPTISIARYILQDIKRETASEAILCEVIRFFENKATGLEKTSATEIVTRVLEF